MRRIKPSSVATAHGVGSQDSHQASQRRALLAASLAFLLALVVALGARSHAASSSAAGTGPALNGPSLEGPSLEGQLQKLMVGSAISFPERSKAWLEALLRAPGEEHPPVLSQLTETLFEDEPERSTRAAVLLGGVLAHNALPPSTRRAAQSSLIYRLEQRKDVGARWKVGADVAAARALDRPTGSGAMLFAVSAALTELAHGTTPHPNLAVRVECAATVLKIPAASPAPRTAETTAFLLAVLRAETPAQAQSPRTWPRITTLAWVKTRAAQALARKAGTENRFRPDGPWAHQVAEAERLESLLR